MPDASSIQKYVNTVVGKLMSKSVNDQEKLLKQVRAKVSERADDKTTDEIMATIRSALAAKQSSAPTAISGLSVTKTMIDAHISSTKKRASPPSSEIAKKAPASKKPKAAVAESVTGELRSDGFIVDDVGDGTLIEDEDEEDDDDDDDEDGESDEEIDPVFDAENYRENGKIKFSKMYVAVGKEVKKRRAEREQNLLGGELQKCALPDDDCELIKIRARNAARQVEKTKEKIAETEAKLASATKEAVRELLIERLETLNQDLHMQESIVKQAEGL